MAASVLHLCPLAFPVRLVSSTTRNFSPPPLLHRRAPTKLRATVASSNTPPVDNLVLDPREEDDKERSTEIVDYDWRKEWYPLYLTREVPDDAPLGLAVYDVSLVLYKDGHGEIRCFEDRCPHRLAKLSEGHLIDGKLECLYHGWQFAGDGSCVRIPQLSSGATIPRSACARSYHVRDSQGVLWVWMSHDCLPDDAKLPWFENFSRPGFQDFSTIHELPYDHSILVENVLDPSHVPISHDRTDFAAKREDAKPLRFEFTERTARGFAGWFGAEDEETISNFMRFEAPCVVSNNREFVDKNGEKHYSSGVFLCRPAGQGKSMLIIRFGGTKRFSFFKWVPQWLFHQNACKILEEDMGFLSSQNEALMKDKLPTKRLYLNLKSSDVWVWEYRKWLDKVGHGMPYYIGHSTISLPPDPAVVEHARAGLHAAGSASLPAKGAIVGIYAPNGYNRYFRHVVHCKECTKVTKSFKKWKTTFSAAALVMAALAILASGRQWKAFLVASAAVCVAGVYGCSLGISFNTSNHMRHHRV